MSLRADEAYTIYYIEIGISTDWVEHHPNSMMDIKVEE
jgi:hypothetical protein